MQTEGEAAEGQVQVEAADKEGVEGPQRRGHARGASGRAEKEQTECSC